MKYNVGREFYEYHRMPKKTNKPELSLEAKMTELKQSYFGHIRRKTRIWKDSNAKKSRKQQEKKTNIQWIDSVKAFRFRI